MGTILHEGEYILISRKITNETQFIGCSILSYIGINTSKVNYIGSTENFLTYAVIKDLELPFYTGEWQDFRVKDVRFHAYTKKFKNLILLEHDEFQLDYLDEVDDFFEKKEKEKNEMVLKKENYIFTAVTTWGWTDDTLTAAVLGFLPDDKESHMIGGSEGRILWSKTKLPNDTYYSAIDASIRLHKISDELDFTVTNYGDIIIYRTSNCSYTPQEVIDSYNRYISSSFFVKEEDKEDKENNKMVIEANRYIYISSNTVGSSDNQLLSALFGYVPTCTKYETIHQCAPLWSRTKFLHERGFDLTDAKRRLRERNEKLDFRKTVKGDIIIYKDVHDEVLRILDAYHEYSKRDESKMFNPKNYTISLLDAVGRPIAGRYPFNARVDSHTILTMHRSLGRAQAISMLNSVYGLYPGGFNIMKPPFKFKLIFGIEHATGRYKTICLWEDGEKTIICGDNKVTKLPVAQAFAWCYVKRTFRTVSQFKKHVDKRTTKMDGVWYFEGDCLLDEYAQGSVPGTSKKRDIYDAAALAIVTKRYGGLRKLVDEYINKEE